MATGGNVLLELESAAQILLGPPHLVAHEQRQQAEQVFLNFRKTKNPYQLCKLLLEQSKNDYVLFEASGLLKDGLIREWRELSADDVRGLRAYLLQYVVNNPLLSAYVRERIVQVIAIMVKRRSVEDGGEDRGVVIKEVQQLITGGSPQMQMVGCSIITALMQEYATTVKSTDVGLPWEVHFKAKKQFELTDLQNIFRFSVSALRELASNIVLPLSEEMAHLLRRLTIISETVLTWTFINVNLPKKLISVFESDQNPSLRPGAAWKEVMLDPTLVSFFFDLHWRVRTNESISHHTLNCLVQLASLNGQTMNAKDLRLQYLSNYISSFSSMVDNISASGRVVGKEALGLSAMIRKLILFYPPSILVSVRQELLQKYLEQVVSLTCGFMRAGSGASQNKDQEEEADLFTEATEHVLEAWVCILHENTIFPQGYCKEAAAAIFKTYIEVSLAPPDGLRSRQGDEEIEETEESDRVRFKDTLSTIGALGRECLDFSLPLLISLLEGRISRLHGQIQRISSQGGREIDQILSDLFEDVHWTLLIAGNVLSLDVDGETALIPAEVMQHSIGQAGSVDVSKSLEVLASPGQPASEIPGHESSDHVLRMVGAVFRLSEVEKRAVEAGLVSLWSPEIGSTVMWFLRRWSLTYLATQEGYYQEMSIALCTAFGRDTEGAAWTVNFLLEKILSNLTRLHSEPAVVEDSIKLLVSLADCKEKCQAVLASQGLVSLVQLATQQDTVPAVAKRGLLKALVLVGAAQENSESREQYWGQVLKPLEIRYQAIVGRDNLKAIYMEEKVRGAVIDLLESLTGVVQGCHVTTVHQVFGWLRPTLASMVHLLALYHHYSMIVELILELYCETAKRILCYFTAAESRILYENSLSLIRTYADHQVGKRTVDKEAEEEQYRDLLLLMELLTNLLSKDFIDLSPPDNGSDSGENVTAADVCLYGLNIIMPLMSAELLKFPNLCLQYFKTITFVCEIYPEKVTTLNPDLQKNLVASLELGLTSIGVDTVYTLCCDFIQVLGCYMVRQKIQSSPIYEPMRPFLKLLLDLILSQKINSELIPHSSATLYVLICLFQDTYHQLVELLIQSQAHDETNKQRLMEAFTQLTLNIPLSAERIHRIRFRDNFDKFIVNVRGFLFVK